MPISARVLVTRPPEVCRVRKVEWPTLALAAAIYGGWLILTFCHQSLSWWIAPPLAWLVAWHGSLQHEILHGHPTTSRLFNRCLASMPLSLWLPYESYRVSHLVHHADERLTDPLDDPESRYLAPADWQRLGPVRRWFLRVQKTLLGRVLIGPAWTVSTFLRSDIAKLIEGDRLARRAWALHVPAAAVVSLWLVLVCRIDLFAYLAFVVYPSVSLMLIRSFAEHKAAGGIAERTAIVENARCLGLLFLFNNLHAAHHERPEMPWYEIPAWYRANRARLLVQNGGLVYDGYLDVARRYLITSHDAVAHPLGRASPAKGGAASRARPADLSAWS